MELKPLRYFYEVARQGSFTRAAETLKLAQPAISMAIRKLENELELSLFHRRERTISLTDEGHSLFVQAEKILQAVSDAELEMQELKGLDRGEVRVGIPSMLGSFYFPPILMAFRHRYPGLMFSVHEGGTVQLQQMLESGELDLAVIESQQVPDILEARTFLREEMRVVVGRDHPFASRRSVSLEEFFGEELAMFKAGYFHRKVLDQLAREAGCSANIVFETNLVPLIRAIVKQGFGISTLLNMAVEGDPELVTLSFDQPILLDLCISWRKDGYLSRANRTFVDFLLQASAHQAAGSSSQALDK